ncbi:MAG TPA: glycosyltransferase family 2 protein [Candidatus Saccharimonadales bacterium]|nr:glycosyltransferase family 2 protein [Candidatus Saccharimonadales bacterium]
MKNGLSISIVIPVYNEERYIKSCLDAIAAQTVKPLEVIVVDNNCTDRTVDLARQYPFVKIVKESVQGRTKARNAGFNAASGDIIGRIDADSVIIPGWLERVHQDFNDPSVQGVAGLGQTKVFLGVNLYSTFWTRVYFWTTHSFFRAVTMWGANMAVRRSAWDKVKQFTAPDGSEVHEDQDVSLVLLSHGCKIIQDDRLLIKTDGVSYLYWPKFLAYVKKSIGMKEYHRRIGTFNDMGDFKLGFWEALPGALIGWLLTIFFVIYSLICWPIIAALLRYKKNFKHIR